MWAIYSHQVETVKAFIQMGADIEIKDVFGYTPLILAISLNYSDIAKLLIEKHANVNAKDLNGATALIFAANNGNTSIMKLLIDNGADVSVKDNYGQTLLQYALYYRQIDSVALIRMMGGKNTDTKLYPFDEALKAPSRFTPEEGDYLIPAGRGDAYTIAVSDCNDCLIPNKTPFTVAFGPVGYAATLINDMSVMRDEFPKCMEKMGFKLNPFPCIPQDISSSAYKNIKLRSKPKKNISEEKYKCFIKVNNFYDSMWNPQGSFKNDFIDNGNGTITDKSTGLMWQKGGSSAEMSLVDMDDYIQGLNKNQFAGYSEWRVPTIDELASLLILKKEGWGDFYIYPIFEKKQSACWSSDITDISYPTGERRSSVWSVSFEKGSAKLVEISIYGNIGSNPTPSSTKKMYYIRAVRTIKL